MHSAGLERARSERVCSLLYFISDTVYIKLQYVYVVCSIIGREVEVGLGEEFDFPVLAVCEVCGGVRSLVSPCWLYELCLSVWREFGFGLAVKSACVVWVGGGGVKGSRWRLVSPR